MFIMNIQIILFLNLNLVIHSLDAPKKAVSTIPGAVQYYQPESYMSKRKGKEHKRRMDKIELEEEKDVEWEKARQLRLEQEESKNKKKSEKRKASKQKLKNKPKK